jgi:hypothetical protein
MHWVIDLPRMAQAIASPVAQSLHALGGNGGNIGHGSIAGGGQSSAQFDVFSLASQIMLWLQAGETGQSTTQLLLFSVGGSHLVLPHIAIGGGIPQSTAHVPISTDAHLPSPHTGAPGASGLLGVSSPPSSPVPGVFPVAHATTSTHAQTIAVTALIAWHRTKATPEINDNRSIDRDQPPSAPYT